MTHPRRFETTVLAVDCCEHVTDEIRDRFEPNIITVASRDDIRAAASDREIDLIVVGVNRNPMRRYFLNQLRQDFTDVPMLFLRTEKSPSDDVTMLYGEFLIDTHHLTEELEIVRDFKQLFPLEACEHVERAGEYYLVREALRVIRENFSNPKLKLATVARSLSVSPARLSRIVNSEAGVNFRRLLLNVRIAEAKRLLATRRYNVKEVAARTGFADSHYFSRTFKKMTGVNATDYDFSADEAILS